MLQFPSTLKDGDPLLLQVGKKQINFTNMERKIGEIFEYNGEWYQCLEEKTCTCFGCDFRDYNCDDISLKEVKGSCQSERRKDNKSVIFKKLEKVGEPYVVHDHSRNENVTVQDYKLYKSEGAGYNGHETLCFCPHGKIEEIVAIQIKQTKENMEEYRTHDAKEDIPEFDKVVDECLFGEDKLNLKPFDLQKAKQGRPVCTRDGRKARIICFDRKSESPITVLVTEINGIEAVYSYPTNGRWDSPENSNGCDLMMLPEKKEGWVNVYDADTTFYFVEGMVYNTKEEAIKHINPDNERYTTTVKIEWEE